MSEKPIESSRQLAEEILLLRLQKIKDKIQSLSWVLRAEFDSQTKDQLFLPFFEALEQLKWQREKNPESNPEELLYFINELKECKVFFEVNDIFGIFDSQIFQKPYTLAEMGMYYNDIIGVLKDDVYPAVETSKTESPHSDRNEHFQAFMYIDDLIQQVEQRIYNIERSQPDSPTINELLSFLFYLRELKPQIKFLRNEPTETFYLSYKNRLLKAENIYQWKERFLKILRSMDTKL